VDLGDAGFVVAGAAFVEALFELAGNVGVSERRSEGEDLGVKMGEGENLRNRTHQTTDVAHVYGVRV